MFPPILRLAPFLLVLLWSAHANAWCLLDMGPMYRLFWSGVYPELRINVFISIGENSSFLHTGLTLPQAEAIVRRVVAVHNETVGPPYLVYAGTTDKDLGTEAEMVNPMMPRDPGIVIDSFSCEQPLPYPCPADTNACAKISGSFDEELVSKGRATFQPVSGDCPPFGGRTWGLDANLGRDLASTMLHEIGHVLGLDHTNISEADCQGLTDGAGGVSVMRAPEPGNRPYDRDWRRDDLEGLRVIYGDGLDHDVSLPRTHHCGARDDGLTAWRIVQPHSMI
jgi:hypothetical protein